MYGAAKNMNPNISGTTANVYSLGNRVYNGMSMSPNVGPGSVDPAGYIDRDRQAAVKRQLLLQQANNTNQQGIFGGR